MSFTHIEDSGFYDCRVQDDEDYLLQFHVIVNEKCESRKKRSSENNFSINPTIDVHTTTVSPELLQLELLERLESFLSGDGLINRKSKGVCC